jgi:hypothetical protein
MNNRDNWVPSDLFEKRKRKYKKDKTGETQARSIPIINPLHEYRVPPHSTGLCWFELYLNESKHVDINTFSTRSGADTELGIYNQDGTLLYTNDDTQGLRSQIFMQLLPGIYYIVVGLYDTTFYDNFNVEPGHMFIPGHLFYDDVKLSIKF